MKKATGKRANMPDEQQEEDSYRNLLVELEQKAQESYDKTLVALSGGALGVSVAFLKDVLPSSPPTFSGLVLWAWGLWCVSLTCTLFSFLSGAYALRKAVKQIDAGEKGTHLGGCLDILTGWLNAISGIAFVTGAVCFVYFVYLNL